MLHKEARNLLVEAYEKTHDAKGIALVYEVSVPTVYRLAEQKAKTGSVDLRVSKRERKRALGPEACEQIAKTIDEQPDITLREIVEKLELPVGIETVRRAILAMAYRFNSNRLDPARQKILCKSRQAAVKKTGVNQGLTQPVLTGLTYPCSGMRDGMRAQRECRLSSRKR